MSKSTVYCKCSGKWEYEDECADCYYKNPDDNNWKKVEPECTTKETTEELKNDNK